jgi:predicted nucleic-acid-binding Zn-ribbon protein
LFVYCLNCGYYFYSQDVCHHTLLLLFSIQSNLS